MSFTDWLFNKQKTERLTALDPDLIKRDEQFRAMAEKLRTYEAQLSRILANQRAIKEKEQTEDKEQELILRLKEQKLDMKQNQIGKPTSLLRFFSEFIKNSKFRKELELTDADDTISFGKFGDFLIMPDRTIALTNSEGNIISIGKHISQLIYKPESLLNQLKRNKIAVPRNARGDRVTDWDNTEIPDIVYDENAEDDARDEEGKIIFDENGQPKKTKGAYQETQEKMVKVRDALIEREEKIQEQSKYIERLEQLRADSGRELADVKRSLLTYKSSANVNQTELSLAMNKGLEFEKRAGDLMRENAKLLELKVTNETIIEKLKGIQSDMMDKVNIKDSSTIMEQAQSKLQEIMDYAYAKTPTTIVQNVSPEPQPKVPTQPGQVLK